jgi:hypothetical protein
MNPYRAGCGSGAFAFAIGIATTQLQDTLNFYGLSGYQTLVTEEAS